MAALVKKTHLGLVENRYDLMAQEGRVVCACMKWEPGTVYEPCRHVWAGLRDGMDAVEEDPLQGRVLVPLFKEPIHGAYLAAWVDVRHEEARHGMRPFYFERDLNGRVAGDDFLGWLGHGEGRYAMRRVIFEYLRSMYGVAPTCNKSTHSFYLLSGKERAKLDLDSTNMNVLAAVASVLQTGACWRCHHANDDDLIPQL